VDVEIHIFLTSALLGGEWSTSPPPPHTHWIGDWVGPRASLDVVEKRKFLTLPGLKLPPLALQYIASHCTDCAIPSPYHLGIVDLNLPYSGAGGQILTWG
jgi:hypothetical protein